MKTIDLTNHKFPNDRTHFRKELVGFFLKETPGTGKNDNASRYVYIVKRLDNHEVYLKRPAQFNNGFDFTLHVSNVNFNKGKGRATTRPTHENILHDLANKKQENKELYNHLLKEITNIYNCRDPFKEKFKFEKGYPSDLILECIKWLFAEQDITYWNYSGRAMLFNKIQEI